MGAPFSSELAFPLDQEGETVAGPNAPGSDMVFASGSMAIEAGDYQLAPFVEAARNRTIRRLLTRRGTFLRVPTWGCLIADAVKSEMTPDLLQSLEVDTVAQLSSDPDLDAVSVSLTPDAPLLTVTVAARVRGVAIEISQTF